MKNKAQVTIFIIIAIVIVGAIIIYLFIFARQSPSVSNPTITEPEQYIEKCAKDTVSEAVSIILPQGGSINPGNYKIYQDDKVGYLCYTNAFYKPCIIQQPLFIEHIENEIYNYSYNKIDSCFMQLKTGLEQENYNVNLGSLGLKIELIKNSVEIKISRSLDVEKNGETRNYKEFNAIFNSPLYSLASIALEIANQEAKYCNFEYVGYMILYPQYNIDKKSVGSGLDASKIYIIEDRYTGKKLNIAVRSCAIPPGF